MSNYLIPGEVRCWSCGKWMSNNELENADGCCPFCDEEIHTNEPPYTSDSEQGGPMNDITATGNADKQALDDALDFDLFEGDFGTPGDTELSNKIVTGRREYKCHVCAGPVAIGEVHRSATWKFDGELMSYRCCNTCCVAMVASVNGDYEENDPIEARYALGHERKEMTV